MGRASTRLLQASTALFVLVTLVGEIIRTPDELACGGDGERASHVLLVIGSQGALVIGPPVSIVSAIGNAARSEALIKDGKHLERNRKIDLLAFDEACFGRV